LFKSNSKVFQNLNFILDKLSLDGADSSKVESLEMILTLSPFKSSVPVLPFWLFSFSVSFYSFCVSISFRSALLYKQVFSLFLSILLPLPFCHSPTFYFFHNQKIYHVFMRSTMLISVTSEQFYSGKWQVLLRGDTFLFWIGWLLHLWDEL